MIRTCVVLVASLLASTALAETRPRIAIIIDDLGYALHPAERLLALDLPMTFAILPNAPKARPLAEAAQRSGQEVIVHLPLQAMQAEGSHGSNEITLDMTAPQVRRAFSDALRAVPFAVGINNHRGSLLTQHPGHMQWIMDSIRCTANLFFVDSYTTHLSVAMQIAGESGIPAVKRDVFLDSSREPADIEREIARLKALARESGQAVAIGHPYPETLELLEVALPAMLKEGFDLVHVSELVQLN